MTNSLKRKLTLPLTVFVLSGCELLCQAGTGTCGLSNEQVERLLHPKGYGEYWAKVSMTKESWQQDWVACGGMTDGQFYGYSPPGSSTQTMLAAVEKEKIKKDACMQAKGYTFSYTNP